MRQGMRQGYCPCSSTGEKLTLSTLTAVSYSELATALELHPPRQPSPAGPLPKLLDLSAPARAASPFNGRCGRFLRLVNDGGDSGHGRQYLR